MLNEKRGDERDPASTRRPVNRADFTNSYMRAVVAAGATAVVLSIAGLRPVELGLPYLLLVLVTLGLGSRIVVRFFRFDSYISLSEVFIFLTFLLFDGGVAI